VVGKRPPKAVPLATLLAPLSRIAQVRRYAKGQQVFLEGMPADGFALLNSGCIRLYCLGESGREVEIQRFGPGQMVGAALALAQGRFLHFGEACEETEVMWYPANSAMAIIVKTPTLAKFFLQELAAKCQGLTSRLGTLQLQTVRERLLHRLTELCPHGGECGFALPMPKRDLAKSLGTTPETLSRTFQELQDEGIITVQGKQIQMLGCERRKRLGLCSGGGCTRLTNGTDPATGEAILGVEI
jgi:CRP/FNR family transcriptional regulator